MTITIICEVLGAENNGTAIATMNLVRYLKSCGHTLRIVCPADGKRNDGTAYYILPTVNLLLLNGYVAKNGVSFAKADRNILHQAIAGSDVVHISVPFFVAAKAVKIAKSLGIPITGSFHCQAENFTNHIFLMNSNFANKAAYRIFYRHVYRYCNAIHYPTDFICNVFEKQVGATNHYVISNGVNASFVQAEVSRPASIGGKFLILFTGRFSREKSHRTLVDAVAKSVHANEIQLFFAGCGPLEDQIRSYAQKKLPNAPIMRFCDHDEMVRVINMADLYVHPAEIEIEAIACLEAIACGKVPIINDSPRSATRAFALSDKNLFRHNDSDDLSKKIDFWIEHPEQRRACSAAYMGYSDRFSFADCMSRMEQMLTDAAGHHTGNGTETAHEA